jgi:hypothetical protein
VSLTNLGQSLEGPLAALGRWVEINWDEVEAPQRRWLTTRQDLIERRLTIERLAHFEVPQLSLKCYLTWCNVVATRRAVPVAVLDSAYTIGSLRERCSGPW